MWKRFFFCSTLLLSKNPATASLASFFLFTYFLPELLRFTMRSLAVLSASSPVATMAAVASSSRPRALVPALRRRPVAAAFALAVAAAAAKAERRGVVSVAAAASSRRSVRVSVSVRQRLVAVAVLSCYKERAERLRFPKRKRQTSGNTALAK